MAYAILERDHRIWLEQEHIHVGVEGVGADQYNSLNRADALQGDALWGTGRQLYDPALTQSEGEAQK